jgi:hypothetical protein
MAEYLPGQLVWVYYSNPKKGVKSPCIAFILKQDHRQHNVYWVLVDDTFLAFSTHYIAPLEAFPLGDEQ